VRLMPPPQQHVGRIEHVAAEAVLRLLERCRAHLVTVGRKRRGQRGVDALGIDRGDLWVRPLMAILVPYRDPERTGHVPSSSSSAMRTVTPPARAERIAANITARLFWLSMAVLVPAGGAPSRIQRAKVRSARLRPLYGMAARG